jgi:protein TonB
VTRRRDLITAAVAVVVHAGVAVAIVRDAGPQRPRSRPIEVEFRRPTPAPVKPAAAAKQAEPRPEPARPTPRPARRKVALAPAPEQPVRAAPQPPSPDPQPAKPAPPAFAIAMDSPTVASSPVSAPVGGGTTVADPGRPGRPGPAVSGKRNDAEAVSAAQVKVMPEIDTDACASAVTYPPDAERNGIEGKVRLRVALDERGKVSTVRVLSGLGYGLDQAAAEALKHRCKFTPARADDGRAVPFVIESYTFNFELPR